MKNLKIISPWGAQAGGARAIILRASRQKYRRDKILSLSVRKAAWKKGFCPLGCI
jgi:hypothetical protein